LLLVKESQVDLIADSEDGRMIVGMLLETVYFGISSTGMALMFLAIVADRPSSKDSPTDPEKYLARLAKTIWSMYRNYRQGKR
jgi:hypothetical protein